VLTLLLVGLVVSGEITIIVSISVLAAWFVAILSLAKWKWLNQQRVVGRLVIFLGLAFLMASVANRYVKWCLYHYAKTQPKPVESTPAQSNGQLAQQMKELFRQELRSLPAPIVAHVEPQKPKGHPEAKPVVRITGLILQPLEAGKPIVLAVHFINEHDELVTLNAHFCDEEVETLPDEFDVEGAAKWEDKIWQCVEKNMREGPRVPIPGPPKAEMQITDVQNAPIMTDEIIQKLNAQSGIYIAGVLEDVSGRYKPTPYCVRVDKSRTGQGVVLCHSFSLPKTQR
jgi:hypothetical protein